MFLLIIPVLFFYIANKIFILDNKYYHIVLKYESFVSKNVSFFFFPHYLFCNYYETLLCKEKINLYRIM